MRSFIFIVLILLSFALPSYSQQNKIEPFYQRAQSVFFELGGNGIILSGNYDLRFAKKQNGFGARVGIGYVSDFFDRGGLSFPVGVNYLAGKKTNYLELGIGATVYTVKGLTLFKEDRNKAGVIFVPSLGYRYQPISDGLTFRIFASPLIGNGSTFWAGLSIGYKF